MKCASKVKDIHFYQKAGGLSNETRGLRSFGVRIRRFPFPRFSAMIFSLRLSRNRSVEGAPPGARFTVYQSVLRRENRTMVQKASGALTDMMNRAIAREIQVSV